MSTLLKRLSWPRWLVLLGLLWGLGVLIARTVGEPTPENLTYLLAIPSSGLYTVLLYLTRRFWQPWLAGRPVRNAALLGIANAAIVETLFLVAEKLMGAQGIAAHPNLLIDLLVTMPWYIGVVLIFCRVQARQRFSPATVLLLGALYEVGGDGLVGGLLIPALFGPPPDLVGWVVLVPLLAFWQFIPVYSSLVLPPAWVLESVPPSPSRPPAWRDALLPLLWILPFSVYVLLVMIVLSQIG
jgi:hypothetical protein